MGGRLRTRCCPPLASARAAMLDGSGLLAVRFRGAFFFC